MVMKKITHKVTKKIINKNTRIKKLGIGMFIITIAMMGIVIQGNTNKANLGDALLEINHIPIPEQEFRMFVQDEKALTASYFTSQYGAEMGKEFWNKQYGQEVPIKVAKQNALQKLIKVKVEQQLAVEYGIVQQVDFKEIKKQIENQTSIYGVENMEGLEAYTIYHSKIVLDTLAKYKLATPPIAKEKLMDYYNKEQMTAFKYPDDIKAVQVSITGSKGGEISTVVEAVKQDIQKGITIKELQVKYGPRCELGINIKEYGQKESKEENGTELENKLKDLAYTLKPNQMAEPVAYGEYYYIMICLERREGQTIPFETAKISIEEKFKEEKFNQEVEKRVKKAKIQINKADYNKLEMH